MIKAEGSGIVYLEPELFEGKNTLIVDLGGLNLGGSLYKNKVCKNEDRFIEECGHDRLVENVRYQLIDYRKGNNVTVDEAEKALSDGGLKKSGEIDMESVSYLRKAKENYYKEVMKHIKEHKIDIDLLDKVVFVGGTTQHIKEIISKEIRHAYVPVKSQWSTVEGLYKIAIKKYGK